VGQLNRLAALRYDDGSRQVRRRSRRRSSCPTAGWMRPPRGCSGCCRSTRTGRWTRTAFNGVRWADADAGNILAGTATDLVLNQETWADPPRRPLRRARDPRPPVRHGHHGPSRRELGRRSARLILAVCRAAMRRRPARPGTALTSERHRTRPLAEGQPRHRSQVPVGWKVILFW